MKKALIFSFLIYILTSSIFTTIKTETIGAKHLKLNNKNIFIYYDFHDLSNPNQFEYLTNNIFLQINKSQNLTIFVENYCYGRNTELATDLSNIYVQTKINNESNKLYKDEKYHRDLLEKFNECIGVTFYSNVSIKSCECRKHIYFIDSYLQEIIANKTGQTFLGDKILSKIYEETKNATFTNIFELYNKLLNTYIYKSQDENLKNIFINSKKILNNNYLEFIKPIKEYANENILDYCKNYDTEENLIAQYICSYNINGKLFSEVLEAKALFKALTTDGDIALFLGAYHGFKIEEHLKTLGYTVKKTWNIKTLNKIFNSINDGSIKSWTTQDIANLGTDCLKAYNWMLN